MSQHLSKQRQRSTVIALMAMAVLVLMLSGCDRNETPTPKSPVAPVLPWEIQPRPTDTPSPAGP